MRVNVLVGRNGGEEGKAEVIAAADSYTLYWTAVRTYQCSEPWITT